MNHLLTDVDVNDRRKRSDHQAFVADLRRGHHARMVVAAAQQVEIQRVLASRPERHVNGLGKRIACVHPDIYWEMCRRYGMKCWRDPKFMRRMMQDEPSIKTHSRPDKLTLRVNGLKKQPKETPKGAAKAGRIIVP